MFETYDKYRDSVYYDASAWSLGNFYNMKYKSVNTLQLGDKITSVENLAKQPPVEKSNYAYVMDWDDYNAPAALHYLQQKGIVASSAAKPFTAKTRKQAKNFNYGAVLVSVSLQKQDAASVHKAIIEAQDKFDVPIFAIDTGLNLKGIDLGSGNIRPIKKTKVAMLIGDGVRSYEAGEVWHLLDTRVGMPITKIPLRNFNRVNLDKYTSLVMVSGRYDLSEKQIAKIKDWTSKGNTLITIGTASKWVIDKKIVDEKLTKTEKDSTKITERKPYVDARENIGKESVGGIILKVDLDITHPLAYGYRDTTIPVYKNNTVWLAPSKNSYATVARYTQNPLIDGFITKKNMEENIKTSASLLISKVGSGRVVLFADNPNFRGSWYGTNRLFLNALFLGDKINIPSED
jgi:hypothetical protein